MVVICELLISQLMKYKENLSYIEYGWSFPDLGAIPFLDELPYILGIELGSIDVVPMGL